MRLDRPRENSQEAQFGPEVGTTCRTRDGRQAIICAGGLGGAHRLLRWPGSLGGGGANPGGGRRGSGLGGASVGIFGAASLRRYLTSALLWPSRRADSWTSGSSSGAAVRVRVLWGRGPSSINTCGRGSSSTSLPPLSRSAGSSPKRPTNFHRRQNRAVQGHLLGVPAGYAAIVGHGDGVAQ